MDDKIRWIFWTVVEIVLCLLVAALVISALTFFYAGLTGAGAEAYLSQERLEGQQFGYIAGGIMLLLAAVPPLVIEIVIRLCRCK